MNENKWNSLPADVQKIIEVTSRQFIKTNDDFQNKLSQDRMQSAPQEFDMQVFTPSSLELARWVAADRPVLGKFVTQLNNKGLPGDNLKMKYLALEMKYASTEYAPK